MMVVPASIVVDDDEADDGGGLFLSIWAVFGFVIVLFQITCSWSSNGLSGGKVVVVI